MEYIMNTVQVIIFLFACYIMLTIDPTLAYKRKMNHILYLILMIITVLGLVKQGHNSISHHTIGVVFICIALGLFLYLVSLNKVNIHAPMGYLSVYLAALGITIITLDKDSPLFPEVFLLAAIFASINAGRKVSMGVSLLSIATIVFIYFQLIESHSSLNSLGVFVEADFLETTIRVVLTILLLVITPQWIGYLFIRKIEQSKKAKVLQSNF